MGKGGGRAPPPVAGGGQATPKGVAGPPLQLFFFEFFLNFFYKNISIFIYFLINLYFLLR
jgi:hypothetical protein